MRRLCYNQRYRKMANGVAFGREFYDAKVSARMRLIDQLAALQSIDTNFDADRHRYGEIQAALQEPETLRAARLARDQAATQVEHWRRERQQRETAINDQQARIKAQERQLYGSKVKDAREQISLQQNVEMLKRQLGRLEEAALEAILEVEQAESDLQQAEGVLADRQTAWQQQERELQAERETLITRARQTKSQRDAAVGKLAPDLFKRYEALRQKHGSLAVAKVQAGNCGGCGANLPTAVRQQAHGDGLTPCPICGRLLYG